MTNTTTTGREFEKKVLRRSSARHPLDVPYQRYEAAYLSARRDQPPGWHPRNPASFEMRQLLATLRDIVRRGRGANTGKALPKLGLFAATDTALDYWHGVDAFIEWSERCTRTGKLNTVHVTLDLTVSRGKRAGARLLDVRQKADFILDDQDLRPEAVAAKAPMILRLLVDRRQMYFGTADWSARIHADFARHSLSPSDADAYIGRVRRCGPVRLNAA
jgi:hypothetical protein